MEGGFAARFGDASTDQFAEANAGADEVARALRGVTAQENINSETIAAGRTSHLFMVPPIGAVNISISIWIRGEGSGVIILQEIIGIEGRQVGEVGADTMGEHSHVPGRRDEGGEFAAEADLARAVRKFIVTDRMEGMADFRRELVYGYETAALVE